jgi:hypothetical protein
MRPVFVDMVNEVQKSIGYYQSLNRDADLQKLVGMGSTFRLPGLQKFLKQQLQLDVSRHDQFTRIDVEGRDQAQFSEHALEMAPAYGLALQGIEQEAVNCNVLPTVLIRQQVWRTKAPLNIAAAVLFSAAAVIGYSNLWSDRQAYYANAQLKGQAEAILKTAKDKQSKWTEIEGGSDPRSKIENLRRILDYRNVWPSVLTDVEQAIQATDPQPELLSSDVEAIKSIPRQTRRLVRVESINYEYESKNNDTTDIWGQRQNQTIDDYVTDVSEFQRPSAATTVEAADVAPSDPPTLIVRLVGTTTREDAPRFLNQTLIKYLNDKESQMREADRLHKENPIKHEDGRDRPYRITKVELKDLVPLLDARTRGTGGAAGRGAETERPGAAGLPGAEALPGVQGLPGVRGLPGATPARPRPGRLPGVRGLPGAGGGEFGEFGEFGPEYGDEFGGAGGRAARGATAELVTLLPGDPLAGEERNTDWRFVLEWRVELIRPEEARQVDQEAERSGPVASAEERQ